MGIGVMEQNIVAKKTTQATGQPDDATTAGRDDMAVKMDRTVAKLARTVCEFNGVPMAQYLTSLVEDRVRDDWRKIMRDQGPKK